MSASPTLLNGSARPNTAGAVTAAAGTAGNANAGHSDAATAGQGQDKVAELLESMKKQADGQSAVINRLQKELKDLRGRLEPATETEGEAQAEGDEGKKAYKSPYMRQLQELQEFKTRVEQERQSAVQESLVQSAMFNLTVKGVNRNLAQMAAETLRNRIGNRVALEKDTLGRSVLVVKGNEGEESVTMESFMEAFIASDEGKALLPQEPNPSLRGLPGRRNGAAEGKVRITKADLLAGRFDMEAMKQGKIVVQE